MTKKQLIKQLDNYPDNIQIYLSSDSEGNGFRKLFEIASLIKSNNGDDMDFYNLDEDVKGKKVLVLWPN